MGTAESRRSVDHVERDAGLRIPDPSRPRLACGVVEAMQEPDQQAGVLLSNGADAEATLLPLLGKP
jgi:hypothetical protein